MSSARSSLRVATVAGVLLGLAACAAPTPFQPSADGFGYADEQIETNRFLVTFAGNSVTPRTVVETYVLYRAAEITLASGYDWFVIAGRETDVTTNYTGWVNGLPGWYGPFGGGYYGWGPNVGVGFGGGTISANPITRYTGQAMIVVFKGEKPQDNVNAYDARDVIQRLKPKVELPAAQG
jgi:hypothetical protein